MPDDPNYHVDIPAPIKAMITRFEKACHDHAFIGAAMPDQRPNIEDSFKYARHSLEQTIKTYLNRAKKGA